MKKTIICAIAAAALSFSAVPFCASADTGHDYNAEEFADCIELADNEWSALLSGNYETVFIKPNDDHGVTVYPVERYPDNIQFRVSKTVDQNIIEDIIDSVGSGFELNCYMGTPTNEYNCTVYARDQQGKYCGIDTQTVKALYKALAEYASGFDYCHDIYTYTCGAAEYLTAYEPMEYDFSIEEKLEEYLESSSADATLVKCSEGEENIFGQEAGCDMFYVVPDEDVSAMEHFKLAVDIAENTGLHPHMAFPAGLDQTIGETRIDVSSSVDGDANDDNDLTLNDAVAVLQNIALPAKYPLTPQGRFNADCDGKAGISGGDALWIQMKDAGLI